MLGPTIQIINFIVPSSFPQWFRMKLMKISKLKHKKSKKNNYFALVLKPIIRYPTTYDTSKFVQE